MAEVIFGANYDWTQKIMFIWEPANHSDSYFRNSVIQNFGEVVFGDKPVSHRVMRGTVTPYISEGELPWDKNYRETWVDYHYRYFDTCVCGVNACTSTYGYTAKKGRYDAYFNAVVQTVIQFFAKEDGVYYRYWSHVSDSAEEVEAVDSGAIVDPGKGETVVELRAFDWNGHLENWPVYRRPQSTFVSYELFDAVPYNWEEYMAQIRPWTRQDEGALSEVIRNTIQDATSLKTNNYANVLEIIDAFRSVRNFDVGALIESTQSFYKRCLKEFGKGNITGKRVRGAIMKGAKWAADGWLKYRYAYNTTKSDIEEYIQKVVKKETQALQGLTPSRVLRGAIGISNGTLRVKMRLHDNPYAGFDRMLINADRRGFMPGLYNLWDMIPFSFVADWFSGLGDIFQDIDQSLYFRYYKVDELLVTTKQSLSRDEIWGLTDYKWYDRVILEEFPQWEVYEDDSTSGKVITYRAMDFGSLCIGVI